MSRTLKIATAQHPVGADIYKNFVAIKKLVQRAGAAKADILHLPECNLSGYAGIDFQEFPEQDDRMIQDYLGELTELAQKLKLWIIVGSHHFAAHQVKPFNSLYLINAAGLIVDRYDKRHLTQHPETDHLYYSAGNRPVVFTLKGIRCGLLICHEWRYPEFYREYLSQGVEVIFQSFYDGGLSQEQYENEGKHLGALIQGAMRGNAANNYCWISASNTSRKESCYASFVLRPDGRMQAKLPRNKTGLTITEIDFDQPYADPSKYWRKKLLNG